MKINKLELTDFGPFYRNHQIELKPGVNIIYGSNGSGKTCLFQAVQIGLFGNINSEKCGITKKLINRRHLDSGGQQASVKINFTLLGEEYCLERTVNINGEINTEIINHRKQKKQTEHIIEAIYQKLPPYTSQYFLFDGEEIRQWMMSLTNDRWDTASLFGFNLFRGLINDLETAKVKVNELLTDLEHSSGITIVREKLEDIVNDIQQNKNSILQIESNIKELEAQLQIMNEILGYAVSYKNDLKKLKLLNKEINTYKKDLVTIYKRARNNAQWAPYSILKKEFIEALELVEHMKHLAINARLEQGRLDAQLEILQEIEGKETCICGNELAASAYGKRSISKLVEELEHDLKKFDKAASAEFWPNMSLMDMCSQVELAGLAAAELKKDLDEINKIQTELNKLTEVQKLYKSKIKEVINKVQLLITQKNIPEKIWPSKSKLTNKISKLDRKKNILNGRRDIHNDLIKKKNTELKYHEKELAELQNQRRVQLDKFINADRTLEQLSGVINEAVTDAVGKVIKDLKTKFKEIFKTITNKPHEFIDVDFSSSEGTPMIITQNGTSLSMTDISDGEKQILMLALMSALKHLSPTEALVVDAPFGRLDSAHINSITKFLPKMAPQTIIMITDREFKEINKPNMAAIIWKIQNDQGIAKFELLK